MTLCPHTHKQCVCQPSEGIPCEYAPVTDAIDTHDPAGMAGWLRERAKANREIAGLPIDQWPHRPDVLRHWALRFEQAADMVERLDRKCGALATLLYGTPENPKSPAEPEAPRNQAMGVSLPITEHRYSQGDQGIWKWDQNCRCRRCYEEYERVVAEQRRAENRKCDCGFENESAMNDHKSSCAVNWPKGPQ